MFQHFRIRTKFLIALGIIVLFVALSGLVGVLGVWQTSRVFHAFVEENISSLQNLFEIRAVIHEIETDTMAFEFLEIGPTLSEGTPGGDLKFSLLEKIEKLNAAVDKYKEYETAIEHSQFTFLDEMSQAKDQGVLSVLEFIRLKEQGITDARLFSQKQKIEEARTRLKESIREAANEELQDFHEKQQITQRIVNRTIKIILIIALAALIISLFVGILLSASIVKPVTELRDTASAIASGQLSHRVQVKTKDEVADLGRSFNAMADQIQQEIDRRIREEEKFRRVVESAPYGMVTVNAKGEMVLINSELEKMFGYSREELKGQPIEKLMPERFRKKHVKDRDGFFDHPAARQMGAGLDLSALHKDGHEFPVDISLNPTQTPEGLIVLATIADLSQRKMLEQQLFQAQKMEAIGKLAEGIAHDFNNLLCVMVGYAEFLQESFEANDPRREQLSEIRKTIDRASQLVQQLLAFGSKQSIRPVELNLNTFLSDVGDMLRRIMMEDIELTFSFDPKTFPVRIDPVQMQQIILNLVTNARDAMPKGGKLMIETHPLFFKETYVTQKITIPQGSYTMLAVSDTGTGMNEETKKHLFEPFFTTKEQGKGTGLGLATIYGIVKQNNGHIWVYSEVGKGTTFKICFPSFLPSGWTVLTHEVQEEIASPKGSETIVVVEDEEAVRHIIVQVLRQQGYQVLETTHGQEALHVLREHTDKIDLLISDVVMPKMGGRQLVDKMKRFRPEIKVIFISGYPREVVDQHGELDPNLILIQKPFSPAFLAKKVREVLDA